MRSKRLKQHSIAPDTLGRMEKLCYRISQEYCHPLPERYEQCLKEFKDLVKTSGTERTGLLPAHVLRSGEGLYLVNKFRHALAHWDCLDVELEEHPEWE